MPFTAEERAAQHALQAAIEAQVTLYRDANVQRGQPDDKGMVTDWVLVVHTMSYDERGDEESGYYMSYANGQMPDHRAIGLLRQGEYMIRDGMAPDNDED